jgi:hypothetical protein
MRAGGGHAGVDGSAVRPGEGRVGLLHHHRRLHPRRDHRHGGRPGHRHGTDHPAGDDAVQVRHALCDRRARRVRYDHSARSAVAGARRPGRSARPVGRRHVSGRLGPVTSADRAVCRLYLLSDAGQAGRPSAGAADAVRQGAPDQVRVGHHPGRGPDLPGAGHHHDGPGHSDRGGRDGYHRRDRPRGGAQRTAHQVRSSDVPVLVVPRLSSAH